jgi:hypothetical protein
LIKRRGPRHHYQACGEREREPQRGKPRNIDAGASGAGPGASPDKTDDCARESPSFDADRATTPGTRPSPTPNLGGLVGALRQSTLVRDGTSSGIIDGKRKGNSSSEPDIAMEPPRAIARACHYLVAASLAYPSSLASHLCLARFSGCIRSYCLSGRDSLGRQRATAILACATLPGCRARSRAAGM